jgi:hypothetical protein
MVIDRIAGHRWRGTALVGLVSLLIGIGLAWNGRMPDPDVHDEFSYLLAADTFAHGRLTNPTHPLWQHFESFHIIHQPTYASKYPVGQGLSMAVGQLLTGRPIVGVWLTIALACMAITWMLRAFVPPRWALAGGLLAAIHPQVMRWDHSYWGGGVAMLGGALLVGAARRFMDRPGVAPAAIMSAAAVVLANSRPFEGFIVAALVGVSVLVRLWSARRQLTSGVLLRVAAAVMAVAVPACAWMGYYNWRVTGHPLEMPYMTHQATYAVVGSFGWQSRRAAPVYRHEVMRRYWSGDDVTPSGETPEQKAEPLADSSRDEPTVLRDWFRPFHRDKKVLFYSIALNPGLLLAFVGVPFLLVRDRWGRWAVAMLVAGTAGILLGTWMFPHYAAPLVGLVFLVVIMSLRELAAHTFGRAIVAVVFAVSVIAFAVEYRRSTHQDVASDTQWYRYRAKIAASLGATSEPDLVIVRYKRDHRPGAEWVYNDADIDRAPVVWAREMDAAHNEQLVRYFATRRIWLVEADAPEPTPVPFDRGEPGTAGRLAPTRSGSD